MLNFNQCGLCSAINIVKLKNTDNVSAIKIPKIKKKLKKKLMNYISTYNMKENIVLGIHKFYYNKDCYIHCPIKKVSKSGKIKIGICKGFNCLKDSFRSRQKLSTHKYRYHFKSNKKLSKFLILKVSKSLKEVLFEETLSKNNL